MKKTIVGKTVAAMAVWHLRLQHVPHLRDLLLLSNGFAGLHSALVTLREALYGGLAELHHRCCCCCCYRMVVAACLCEYETQLVGAVPSSLKLSDRVISVLWRLVRRHPHRAASLSWFARGVARGAVFSHSLYSAPAEKKIKTYWTLSGKSVPDNKEPEANRALVSN